MLLCSLILLSLAPSGARAQGWQPGRTWAFVVGLYKFERPALYSDFDLDQGRVDDRLVSALRDRGVAAARIVTVRDARATRDMIRKALRDLLARTAPGDTLLVYFGSHGDRDEHGTCYLVPYDATADSAATCISCASLVRQIDAEFHGAQVLIALDTCNSGGMVEVLERTPTRVPFACLASCLANEESSDWDFTECLIDGLRGQPLVDLNGDGRVTLDEVAEYTARELAYGQEQIAAFYRSNRFASDWVMATASAPRPPAPVGDHVEARGHGGWVKARVVAARDGRVRVHYYGNSHALDAWVGGREIRPHRARSFARGSHVLVLPDEDEDEKQPATVLNARGEVFLVRYEDGTEEWVEGRRLELHR